jgi:hypothetical protein
VISHYVLMNIVVCIPLYVDAFYFRWTDAQSGVEWFYCVIDYAQICVCEYVH